MNLMSYGSDNQVTNNTMYEHIRQEILKYLGGDENMTAEILALPPDQMVSYLKKSNNWQQKCLYIIMFSALLRSIQLF